MTWIAFSGAVELGIIFSLLAMGIFVSYRILGVPDLTVEGTFTAGAAVSAVFVVMGYPALGLFLAILVGAAGGVCSALLQTKMRIQPILAGILTMTALYSVNLNIMSGRANIALIREDTLFTILPNVVDAPWRMLLPLIVTIVVGALLILFFHTPLGYSVRATGDNEEMVRASSINSTFTKMVALGVANGIAALCGGLIAQYQGFADINMGFGMVVVALASLIIGEALFGRRTIIWNICAVAVGAIIYRIILATALSFRLNTANLRAVSALIVIVAISYPALKNQWTLFMLKRKAIRGGRNA